MEKLTLPLKKINVLPDGIHLWLDIRADGLPGNSGVIVDTGASQSIFDKELMAEWIHDIRDPEEEQVSSGVSDYIEDQQFGLLSGIAMGDFRFERFPVGIMSLSHVQEIYQQQFERLLCGLLGGDFLEKYHALVDYSNAVLILSID